MASDTQDGEGPGKTVCVFLEQVHTGCFQPLTWSCLASDEDERMESLTSGFFLGCEDLGHRDTPSRSRDHSQARGRPPSPPQGPLPPSHVSTLKTTEEKKVFFFTTHSFWYT